MSQLIRIGTAMFVAIFVATAMSTALVWITDQSGEWHGLSYFQALFLASLFFCGVSAILIGAPLFVALLMSGHASWKTAAISGFAIGALMASWLAASGLAHGSAMAYAKVIEMGIVGAVAAFTFWTVWSLSGTSSRIGVLRDETNTSCSSNNSGTDS